MPGLGTVFVELRIDGQKYEAELKGVQAKTTQSAGKMEADLKKAGDAGVLSFNKLGVAIGAIKWGAITYLAQAVLNLGSSIMTSGRAFATMANDIERNSQTLGMSIAEYQKWTYAAKMADVTTEDLITGWKFLSRNIEDAKRGIGDARQYFEALGIKGKTTAEVILELAGRFKEAGNSSKEAGKKFDIAMTLAGKGGTTWIPMLNLGRIAIEGFKDEAVKMGTVLGDVYIKKGSEAENTFKKIDARMNAMKISMSGVVLGIASIFEAIAEGVVKTKDNITWLIENLPVAIEKMAKYVSSFPKISIGKSPAEILASISGKQPISLEIPYYPPEAMEAAGIPFKEGIGIIKPLAMPPNQKWVEQITKNAEESAKSWAIAADEIDRVNSEIQEFKTRGRGLESWRPEQIEKYAESVAIAFEAVEDSIFEAENAIAEAKRLDWDKVFGSDIASIEAQGIAIDNMLDKLSTAQRAIAEYYIERNAGAKALQMQMQELGKSTVYVIDVFDRFSRSIMDVFDGLILGTLKWQDVTKSLTASGVRQFSDMFLEIIKKKTGFDYILQDNFVIKMPNWFKTGADAIMEYVKRMFESTPSSPGSSASPFGGESPQPTEAAPAAGVGTAISSYFAYALAAVASTYVLSERITKTLNKLTGSEVNPEWMGMLDIIGGLGPLSQLAYPIMAAFGIGSKGDEDKKKAEARRIKTYMGLSTMGFEIPLNEKGRYDIAAIREQGGLLGVDPGLGKKKLKELYERAQDIYKAVTDDFANAISEGMKAGSATAGFRVFETTLKDTVYNNVLEGMVKAFTESTMLKNAMTPLYQFLYESVASGLEKGFDVGAFKAGITEKMAPITAMITLIEPIFKDLYGAVSGLSGGSISHTPITIPSFQRGGVMPHTGLAYVHKDEKITPPGGSSGVTVNLNGTQINNDLDVTLIAKKLGRKIDWERRRPQVYG